MNLGKFSFGVILLIILGCVYKFCVQEPKPMIPFVKNPDTSICRDTFIVEKIVIDHISVEDAYKRNYTDREVVVKLKESEGILTLDTMSLKNFLVKKDQRNYKEKEYYVIRRQKIEMVEEYFCNQILVAFNENDSNIQRDSARERLVDSLKLGLVKSCSCSEYEIWGKEEGGIISPEERRGTRNGLVGQKNGSNGSFFKSSLNFLIKLPTSGKERLISKEEFQLTTFQEKPVTIALIDSGINGDAFGNNDFRWTNENPEECYKDFIHGYDFIGDSSITKINSDIDVNGHGTHVAGIILGATISPQAKVNLKLMDLKIFGEGKGSLFNLVCATNYAIDNEADIINQSLGFYADAVPQLLEDVLSKAREMGILVITSAGNDGLNNDFIWNENSNSQLNHYPSDIDLSNIISVGALSEDSIQLWDENVGIGSNYGSVNVDVTAEGEDIRSAYKPNYLWELSGTSMATGQVTRVASILKSRNEKFSYGDIKNCIIKYANNYQMKGPIPFIKPVLTKYGILDTIPSALCY